MPDPITDLIAALHQAPYQYVAAITGGGSGLAGRLLSVPGGSRTVLEMVVPYGDGALVDFLGNRPDSFCSADTSRAMALRACERARRLAPGFAVLVLGCTASLASDRLKRGEHRCHISIHTSCKTQTWSLTLIKEARSREQEEAVVERLALNSLATGLGVEKSVPLHLLAGEEVVTQSPTSKDPLTEFLNGSGVALRVEPDGQTQAEPRPSKLVLPGSFNPLHEAHLELARTAASLEQCTVAFELSMVNVEKPALSAEEVRRRLAQFAWRSPVWVTRAATFVEKARLFPGAALVVGADTAERIVSLRFYQDSAELLDSAFNEFRALGCRLLVAGRVNATGAYLGLAELAIPEKHRDLFQEVPFRRDLSSTQLRQLAEK